jgi:hypothetical protein
MEAALHGAEGGDEDEGDRTDGEVCDRPGAHLLGAR